MHSKLDSERAKDLRLGIKSLRCKLEELENELAKELSLYSPGDKVYVDGKPAVINGFILKHGDVSYWYFLIRINGKPHSTGNYSWNFQDISPRTELVPGEKE